MHESITIPDLVKRLLAAGETTKSLALRLGVSQPTVSRIATGETRDTSWNLGVRIWQAAGGGLTPPPAIRSNTPNQETRDAA